MVIRDVRSVVAVVLVAAAFFVVAVGLMAGGRPEALPYPGGTAWGVFPLEP